MVDPDKAGSYSLCLRIAGEAGADLGEVARRVAAFPQVSVVMRVSGDCEVLALAPCESREEALALLDELHRVPGVSRVESHVVLEAVKLGGFPLK